MSLHPSEAALLEYLASACRTWTLAAHEALENPVAAWVDDSAPWLVLSEQLKEPELREAFSAAVAQLLSGLVHTSLASLSGGSSLAETAAIELRDQSGHVFKPFLHEFWPEHSPG